MDRVVYALSRPGRVPFVCEVACSDFIAGLVPTILKLITLPEIQDDHPTVRG